MDSVNAPYLHPSGRFRIYSTPPGGSGEIYIETLQPIGPDDWPEGWEICDTVQEDGGGSFSGWATVCPIEIAKVLTQHNPLRSDHHCYRETGVKLAIAYRDGLTSRNCATETVKTTKMASEETRQKRREEARQRVELDAPRRIAEAKREAVNLLNGMIERINRDYVNSVTRLLSDASQWDWSEDAEIRAIEDQLASVRQNVKILTAHATKLKEERIADYAAQNLHLPPAIDPASIKLQDRFFN